MAHNGQEREVSIKVFNLFPQMSGGMRYRQLSMYQTERGK
jgi:hypothetical protein